jgi:Skp family chaperone for outer membrane proteins
VRMLSSRKRTLIRKRPLFSTALAALILACLASATPAFGQSQHSQNAATHGVAVVDISYIFKSHHRFRAAMEGMKKDMENIEGSLKVKRDAIAKIEEERNKFNVGSEQYKQADAQLARQMAEFNLEMTGLRKDFLDREAKEYYKTYLEVVDAVGQYAQRHNLGLVIRFNGDPVDPNRREDVLREINKPVVFQNRIDITPEVLQMVNRDQVAQAPNAGAGQRIPGAVQPGIQPGGIQPNGVQPGIQPNTTRPTGTMLPR